MQLISAVLSLGYENEVAAETFAKIFISSGCGVCHQLGYETDDNKVMIISISSHDFSFVATRKGSTRLKAPGKFHL